MNEYEQKSTWPLAQIWKFRLCSLACATVLMVALCFIAIPVGALADENPPDMPEFSDETQPSESSESADSDAGADTETEDEQNVDDSSESENPSDETNTSDSSSASSPTDENSVTGETPDTTPSTQAIPENANSSADANADDDSAETSGESPSSNSKTSANEKKSDRDGKIEREQKTPEEEALDKLEQANAIYDHMSRLASEIDELQSRYDELKAVNDKALSRQKKIREDLKREQEHLGKLKEEMANHVVEMYKQGGVTPYLDVLFGAASYKEFLSLWYMLDKVSHYGESEFHAQVETVKSLEIEMDKAGDRTKEAEKEADEALAKLNRSRLTYLSLAPHAASLKMEAAETLGDHAGFASAQAEYDSAYAKLNDALDQGLAEAGRLEGEGILANPCPDAEYSSGFGYRTFDYAYHLGLDMAISEGTPYYAADNGVVIEATNGGGYNGGAGNWIVIDHGNGVVTKYMHSLVTFVGPGDIVIRGQNIGLVGNTGNSFGAHLHFQVEIDGVAVDPLIYL